MPSDTQLSILEKLLYLNYRRAVMLYTILVILLILWLLGFISGVGGGLIHALLVIALVIFIWNLLMGRKRI